MFAKIFDTAFGQVLMTKEFGESFDYGECEQLAIRLKTETIDATETFNYESEAERDAAFDGMSVGLLEQKYGGLVKVASDTQ